MNNKQSQAVATMAKAFEASQFPVSSFTVGIKGTLSEGGAIWLAAQALYPGSVWEAAIAQVTFPDGSAIAYIRAPGSLYSTTYKAVEPLPADSGTLPQVKPVTRWDKFPGESTKRYVVRKFEREWVGNYRREQWVIVFESDDKGEAYAHYLALKGAYYQLADESVTPRNFISGTTEI
ncbi:hypothetical protein D3C87_1455360 [compost metagenome]